LNKTEDGVGNNVSNTVFKRFANYCWFCCKLLSLLI